jgi:hypothetical protein
LNSQRRAAPDPESYSLKRFLQSTQDPWSFDKARHKFRSKEIVQQSVAPGDEVNKEVNTITPEQTVSSSNTQDLSAAPDELVDELLCGIDLVLAQIEVHENGHTDVPLDSNGSSHGERCSMALIVAEQCIGAFARLTLANDSQNCDTQDTHTESAFSATYALGAAGQDLRRGGQRATQKPTRRSSEDDSEDEGRTRKRPKQDPSGDPSVPDEPSCANIPCIIDGCKGRDATFSEMLWVTSPAALQQMD